MYVHFICDEWIDNRIGADGTNALSLSLEYNTSLKTLCLESLHMQKRVFLNKRNKKANDNDGWTENKIGDGGALSLTEAMRHNLQLKTLSFGCLPKTIWRGRTTYHMLIVLGNSILTWK